MIEEAILARLAGTAALTNLVGTSPARIWYGLLPQDPIYPAIRYFRVSAERTVAMGSDPGLVHARFQFDVFDRDVDSVRNVTEQLRKALERWRGTGSGTTVQDAFIENQQEPGPELLDAEATYRSITDVMIHFTE